MFGELGPEGIEVKDNDLEMTKDPWQVGVARRVRRNRAIARNRKKAGERIGRGKETTRSQGGLELKSEVPPGDVSRINTRKTLGLPEKPEWLDKNK